MPSHPPLHEVWPLIRSEDWLDTDFSRKKAYVCAIFAEIAYWHIPAFELPMHDRVKVIPSEAYRHLWRTLERDDLALRFAADVQPVILQQSRLAVVVVMRTSKVIFVAMRGTISLYDWFDNLKAWHHVGEMGAQFHAGFRAAVSTFADELDGELKKYGEDVPVYVTGHSLGGAMAAILHALGTPCPFCGRPHSTGRQTYAAYTYGMPRYTNEYGVTNLRCPYHVLKAGDVVPTIPPTFLNYAHPRAERNVAGGEIERTKSGELSAFRSWIVSLARRRVVANHDMEGYRVLLRV